MQKYLKESACKALGTNPLTVKEAYFAQTTFRCKEAFFEEVQTPNRLLAYTCANREDPLARISRQRFREFSRLRVLQLQDMMERSKNRSILRYGEMLLAYQFGSFLEHEAFMRLINRTEVKVAKSLNMESSTESDIRDFLLISVLFADKHFLYGKEEAWNYLALCDKIS